MLFLYTHEKITLKGEKIMLKARGKLISLLTACMALVLMLVMGITTLSIQPKVASAATETQTYTFSSYTAGTQ